MIRAGQDASYVVGPHTCDDLESYDLMPRLCFVPIRYVTQTLHGQVSHSVEKNSVVFTARGFPCGAKVETHGVGGCPEDIYRTVCCLLT